MKIKCNMHTHTTFCDGQNTPREMINAAIDAGAQTLGFSGHAYIAGKKAVEWVMSREAQSAYVAEISALKNEYADRLEILLGIEQDYFSEPLETGFEFIIGSVHSIARDGHIIDVDGSPRELLDAISTCYGGDAIALVKDYYSLVAEIVTRTDCDIVGHFDLVTKYNEQCRFVDTASKKYRDAALEALDALIEKDRIFELNTGAISRGYRTSPYPEEFLLRRLAEKRARVMLSSDCHSAENIFFGFDDAIAYARNCGVTELYVFKNGKPAGVKI